MLAWISGVSAQERGYIEHYSVAVVCYYGVMMTSFTDVRYHYNICRPVARIFRRGLHVCQMQVYACISMQDYGMLSQENFTEMRCSEIASEAILGQKQSRSSYMTHCILHSIFGCPCIHLLSQLTSNFQERRY